MKTKKCLDDSRGFTLVELLVVIAILGILVSAVSFGVLKYLDDARQTKAKLEIANFRSALKSYYIHTGSFPTTEQGLKALVEKPAELAESTMWKGSYLDPPKIPKDPWRGEYVYESDGETYDIICYGKDGLPGGTGANVDITDKNIDELQ